MLGKFGDKHNKSKPFWIKFTDGGFRRFGSGIEFKRLTGKDNTSITWARRKKTKSYKFKNGGMAGLEVFFV